MEHHQNPPHAKQAPSGAPLLCIVLRYLYGPIRQYIFPLDILNIELTCIEELGAHTSSLRVGSFDLAAGIDEVALDHKTISSSPANVFNHKRQNHHG